MNIKMITITSLIIASLSFAGKEGSGGDGFALDFMSVARDVVKQFKSGAVKIADVDAEELATAIESLTVVTLDKTVLKGTEVDAINYKDEKKIELSRSRWQSYSGQYKKKSALALHEMLSLINVDDSRYQISNEYVAQLFQGKTDEIFVAYDSKDNSTAPFTQILNAWKAAAPDSITPADLVGIRVGREFSYNLPMTAKASFSLCAKKTTSSNGPFFPAETSVNCGFRTNTNATQFDEGVESNLLTNLATNLVDTQSGHAVCEKVSAGRKKCFRKQNDYILYLTIENSGVKEVGYFFKLFEIPDPATLKNLLTKNAWELPVGTKVRFLRDVSIVNGIDWFSLDPTVQSPGGNGYPNSNGSGCYVISEKHSQTAKKLSQLTLISPPQITSRHRVIGNWDTTQILTSMRFQDNSGLYWLVDCNGISAIDHLSYATPLTILNFLRFFELVGGF